MNTRPIAVEINNIVAHLQTGWKLYLIEDRPYPVPHIVVIINGDQSQLVSYSAFVSMNTQGVFTPAEKTTIDGKPAQEFTYHGCYC